MNSENEDNTVASENENSKNLLKIQQLSELGLEFFDPDLDNDGLSLSLLNQDSVSLMNPPPNASKEPITVDFGSFNEYVSDSMMASLSPEQEPVPIIKVLPVGNDISFETDGEPVKNGNIYNAKVSAVESTHDYQIPIIANDQKNVEKLFSNFPLNNLDGDDRLRIKSFGNSNIKMRVSSKLEHNGFFLPNTEASIESMKNDVFMKEFADTSELENKINDSLLDMLQDKIIGKNSGTENNFRVLNKSSERSGEKDVLKFITIFPSESVNKTINLMVKGKTCRSKQPLTDLELRIVTRILNQETIMSSKESVYKNVYYDAESDTNIRYEVKHEGSLEEHNVHSDINIIKNKKGRPKSGHSEGNNQDSTKNDEKYVLKSVARTRCGRVSRPPRHVVRDYKRLKHLTAHNSDVEDENENSGGYADYQVDDSNKQNVDEKEKKSEDLYAPLEPNKRQFSSLSLCPTCGKVYLGYRRMAIHFQKYPDHKNEELLKRLLEAKKKSFDETLLSDSSEINTNEDVLLNGVTFAKGNGAIKKKRKLCRKMKVPSKNSALAVKQLLSTCDVDDLLKYAAPVVASFLSSWEYLLIRSRKLKTKDETFVSSLLKEINVMLKQIRSLSHCLLKPYIENKENIFDKFVIEEEDILRHVLGIPAGAYVVSNDENWTSEFFRYTDCFANDQSSSGNTSVNGVQSVETENFTVTSKADTIEEVNTPIFYETEDRIGFPPLDFTENIDNQLVLNSSSLSSLDAINSNASEQSSLYEKDNNRNGKSITLFKSVTNNYNGSNQLEVIEPLNTSDSKTKMINDSNSNDFSSLNFDSFVNSNEDMMNDFPISLPLLSDNSSDSKDCLHLLRTSTDLLNSLKNIDNCETSGIAGLESGIAEELPSTNNTNLESTFTESNQNPAPCIIDFDSISSNFHCNE